MNKPLKIAVVGVGHLGRHHARIHAEAPDAELVAVVDSNLQRAQEIAAEFNCAAFAKPVELLGKVDAASVAVPTEFHEQVAVPLLEAGIHVLIEKPLARTVAEADAILKAATIHGCKVMTGHTERFNPAVRALELAVDQPRFFEIHRLAAFSMRSTDIDVVLDLMVHDLDLVLHLDGTEPVQVDAAGVAALTDKVDIANARIRFASGCVANLTASRISAEPVRRIRVFQSRTYLACDTGARKVERYRLQLDPEGKPGIDHAFLPIEEAEPLGLELAAFRESVLGDSRPPVDGEQGRRAVELAHRVREAIERDAPKASF